MGNSYSCCRHQEPLVAPSVPILNRFATPPSNDPNAPRGSKSELKWLLVLASLQSSVLFVNRDGTPDLVRQAVMNAETRAEVNEVNRHYISAHTHQSLIEKTKL
jgi:hypothetical protein